MLEINILKDSNYLWADIKGKLIIDEDGKNMFEQISSNFPFFLLTFRNKRNLFLGVPWFFLRYPWLFLGVP